MAFPLISKKLIHTYTDRDFFHEKVKCYSLEEMLAEKTRAVAGQRRFAISRDIYDIHQLLLAGANVQKSRSALEGKFSIKGMDINDTQWERIAARRSDYERNWRKNLSYLVSDPDLSFANTWEIFQEYMLENCCSEANAL